MHNSSREQTSGMRSDDRGAFRDCPGGQDQRIGWEIDHVEAVGKRSEEGDGVSRDHHRLEEKVKWPSEVAPKQNGEKWRLRTGDSITSRPAVWACITTGSTKEPVPW